MDWEDYHDHTTLNEFIGEWSWSWPYIIHDYHDHTMLYEFIVESPSWRNMLEYILTSMLNLSLSSCPCWCQWLGECDQHRLVFIKSWTSLNRRFYFRSKAGQWVKLKTENVISLKYKILKLGQSYEGRDMNVLAITKAGPGAPNIWLEVKYHE